MEKYKIYRGHIKELNPEELEREQKKLTLTKVKLVTSEKPSLEIQIKIRMVRHRIKELLNDEKI